jgi:hypothetical protein
VPARGFDAANPDSGVQVHAPNVTFTNQCAATAFVVVNTTADEYICAQSNVTCCYGTMGPQDNVCVWPRQRQHRNMCGSQPAGALLIAR